MQEKIIKQHISNTLKNKNLRIFSIFVVISFILWFFNALNQEYINKLLIPVTFKNFPQNKANVSDLPNNLVVSVKANGLDILKFEMRKSFSPLTIDLSQLKFDYVNKDTTIAYLLTYRIKDEIEVQLQGKFKVEMISPDTLFFRFSKLSFKKVPVKIDNIKILPQKQFYVKTPPTVEPDSVTIRGPLAIIDTISEIYTKPLELIDVKENIKQKAELIIPPEINCNTQSVTIFAKIEEFTEKTFKIKIIPTNVPDTMKMELFPDEVTVICKVGISRYDNIQSNAFVAIVDYNSIHTNKGEKLYVRMIAYPSTIYSYSYTPEFVDYILEPKKK